MRGSFVRLLGLSGLVVACGRPALPDPRAAARTYADAAERGDAARIYSLMTKDARRTYGEARTRELVKDERDELARTAAALRRPDVRVEGSATVLLADGTEIELALESEGFRVAAADTLPAAARTPTEALEGLRRALARRSYASLLRVLSPDARGELETDLRSLTQALAEPATLDVRVQGDRADVDLGEGHFVTLRREQGAWRVEDVR
ncbi:MAG TPA: hypothetical protein VGQ57_12450 [Polyangiaceae bacterium]|nr:hypothetical protein [Polyangiaceae bacterium]